jgi:hypothetical protein
MDRTLCLSIRTPYGTRTRVGTVKGCRPNRLDEGGILANGEKGIRTPAPVLPESGVAGQRHRPLGHFPNQTKLLQPNR